MKQRPDSNPQLLPFSLTRAVKASGLAQASETLSTASPMTLPTFLSIWTIFSLCFFPHMWRFQMHRFYVQTHRPVHQCILNVLFNPFRWKYQTCHSSRGLWERRAWRRRPCGGVQNQRLQMREGGGKMQHIWIPLTLCACFSSEAELPELHINQYTWLWLPWLPEPTFCLFLHQANKTPLIWRCKFSEISSEILCCRGTAPSCSCKAPELPNRLGLFWPRPPR